jgi:hypothetical protein
MKGGGKMKRTFLLSLLVLSCAFWPEAARAVGFSLQTAEQVYRPGDTIVVTAELYNDYESEVHVGLECLLTSQRKLGADRPVSYPVALRAGESRTVTLFEIYVTEDFPSDEYTVAVGLVQDGVVGEETEITFLVQDTLEEMVVAVQVCKDGEREQESRVFVQGDDIYMSYESPVDGIEVVGTISFSDGPEEAIVLPTVLRAAEAGSYSLRVTASREGYKTSSERIDFSVLEELATIPEVLLTDNFEDGTADGWDLERGWSVQQAYGNYVLSGEGHSWARLETAEHWTDYVFRSHVMLVTGSVHLNYRIGGEGRYYVEFRQEGLDLVKEAPWGNFVQLAASPAHHRRLVWHDVKIVGRSGHLQVYVNNSLEIDFIDSAPITKGSVAVEAVPDSYVHADNFELILFTVPDCLPSTHPAYDAWVVLGKPDCWCWPYQCDGDADGVTSGFPFNYRVFTGDLALIVANWQKRADDPALDPCADIDHEDSGFPFYYRVFTGDLSRIVANWKKKDDALAGDCPRPE